MCENISAHLWTSEDSQDVSFLHRVCSRTKLTLSSLAPRNVIHSAISLVLVHQKNRDDKHLFYHTNQAHTSSVYVHVLVCVCMCIHVPLYVCALAVRDGVYFTFKPYLPAGCWSPSPATISLVFKSTSQPQQTYLQGPLNFNGDLKVCAGDASNLGCQKKAQNLSSVKIPHLTRKLPQHSMTLGRSTFTQLLM